MKTLNIELENCYGIRKLSATLDFSKTNAIAIYAPNVYEPILDMSDSHLRKPHTAVLDLE